LFVYIVQKVHPDHKIQYTKQESDLPPCQLFSILLLARAP